MIMCSPWSVLSLWLILSVSVVAEEEEYDCLQNLSLQCNTDIDGLGFSVYLSDNGIMKPKKSYCIDKNNPSLPDGLRAINTSCIVDKQNNLNFSWDSSDLPEHPQYSISYQFCSKDEEVLERPEKPRNVQGPFYQTLIPDKTYYIRLLLNVSYPDKWYIQTQQWEICNVEKLDPPQINATIQSNQLHLEWGLPKSKSTKNPRCFEYELRVNDEVRTFDSKLKYTEPNLDPTQKYKIWMRVKTASHCCETLFWSDWTYLDLNKSVEVPLDIHIGVIIGIALGLPMILLAILLLCKFQRVFDKLFPPIPGPSIKIRGLLEKDITSQIMSHKCVEVVTEVEVKEDEEEEEEERW
ncbi:interleukin-5 receptor subunit alpha-like [Alosa pseudoharengus]|uniref:interleukin-5 receptor subunit alpha-like n=1 Tax=Alosa pseudoharengus TaxID=34774 RepID=UPI003F8B5FF0